MADFALRTAACEGALWPPGTFAAAYAGNRRQAVSDVIEGDTIAATLRSFMRKARPEFGMGATLSGGTQWSGTATGLLAALGVFVGQENRKDRDWPRSPRALRGCLQNMQAALRKGGIIMEFDRTHQGRRIVINAPADTDTTVTTVTHSDTPNPLKSRSRDGRDARDGGRDGRVLPLLKSPERTIDKYRANVVAIEVARRKRMHNGGDA